MPAVKGLEAGQSHVFPPAVREMDLLSQPGTPDLEGIIRWHVSLLHLLTRCVMFPGPAFGDELPLNGALVPCLGNVKAAITAAKILNVRFPVYTWADNIPVLVTVTGCQPAGAGHVAVAVPVGQESPEKLEGLFPVIVEEITLRFLDLSQGVIEVVNIRPDLEHVLYFLQFHADDDLVTVNKGGKGTTGVDLDNFLNGFFLLVRRKQVNDNGLVADLKVVQHFLGYLAVTTGA